MRVCLIVHCGHLLEKGRPLGSRLWCLTVSLSLSLGRVWYLIVSIPDLCTLTYSDRFSSWVKFVRIQSWVNRFLRNFQLQPETRIKTTLQPEAIVTSEIQILRKAQKESFHDEYISLVSGEELPRNIPDKKRNTPLRTVQLIGRSQGIGQFSLYQCKGMSNTAVSHVFCNLASKMC